VQNAPRVYVVYWGWTSDPSGEQSYLAFRRLVAPVTQTAPA